VTFAAASLAVVLAPRSAPERLLLGVHIAAGGVAILSGFIALAVAKGAPVHRRSGMVFVYAMVIMAGIGAAMAAWQGNAGSTIGGTCTLYFVLTAVTTVRPPARNARRIEMVLLAFVATFTVWSLTIAVIGLGRPNHRMFGLPLFPYVMFGTLGLLATLGDIRVIRRGPLRGAPRIARHPWRMSWALWIATSSFFWGQAKVIPKPFRIMPLLSIPVVAVLVALLYWLWRVRVRQSVRRLVIAGARQPA